MSDKKFYNSDTLTFYDLLKKHQVEIPIIQRDYAQGRMEQVKIRESFLTALYESIANEKPITLDFIYGDVVNNRFQPLDGQQRLTTLFLLHWYASSTNNVSIKDREFLTGFSYETRISSRDFCKELVENIINIPRVNIDYVLSEKVEKISSLIINEPWFFLSWKSDPTINAMLNMLDDIHSKFFNIKDLWNHLIVSNKKLINFYYIELEHIGLTDDLYIKMNARGKLLTTFENIKAGLEKKIRDEEWEKEGVLKNSFSFNIDTIWADFFWRNFRVNNSIDDAFVRFMSLAVMVNTATDKDNIGNESHIEVVKKLKDDYYELSIKDVSKHSFDYLVDFFNLLITEYQNLSEFKFNINFFRHQPNRSFLHEFLVDSEEPSYTQRVLLYAQVEYFLKLTTFNLERYNNWMRVVRNIVSLGDVDQNGIRPDVVRSPKAFVGVVNLISDLSFGCDDIYTFLSNSSNSIKSTFAKNQVEEERTKSKIILNYPELEGLIYLLEDTDTLRGRLDFIFYCIDFDKSSEIASLNLDLFVEVADIFVNNLSSEKHLNNDLRRALLTVEVEDNYNFYGYWWSFWNVEKINKRKLIGNYREIEYLLYSEYRPYLKVLIEKLKEESMQDIAKNFTPSENFPNWKLRLIKEENILNCAKSNYIGIPNDESYCYLLKSVRPRDLDGCIKIQ